MKLETVKGIARKAHTTDTLIESLANNGQLTEDGALFLRLSIKSS